MGDDIRRVVVGPDQDGTTFVRRDGVAPATMSLPAVPGTTLVDVWRSASLPVPVPDSGDPTDGEFELMPEGSLFRIIDLGPTGVAEPMWHQTDAVDFVYVASGSVTFLYDGGTVDLAMGDTVVVGGVRHAWVNRTDEVCRLIDASVALAQ